MHRFQQCFLSDIDSIYITKNPTFKVGRDVKSMKNAGWVFCGAFLNIASLVSFYTVFDSIKTAIVYTMPIIILSLAIVIKNFHSNPSKNY